MIRPSPEVVYQCNLEYLGNINIHLLVMLLIDILLAAGEIDHFYMANIVLGADISGLRIVHNYDLLYFSISVA